MRSHVLLCAGLLVGASAGCEAEGVSDGPKPAEFCAEISEVACEGYVRCCSERGPEAACREQAKNRCLEWSNYLSVEAGQIVKSHSRYRADRAREYIARVKKAAAKCADFESMDFSQIFFDPALSAGDRCLTSEGCPEGLTCLGDERAGRCMPLPHISESCEGPTYTFCADDVPCKHDADGNSRCVAFAKAGDPCDSDSDCESQLCLEDKCVACSSDQDCGGNVAACVNRACARESDVTYEAQTGEACSDVHRCESGECTEGVCEEFNPDDRYCGDGIEYAIQPLWT